MAVAPNNITPNVSAKNTVKRLNKDPTNTPKKPADTLISNTQKTTITKQKKRPLKGGNDAKTPIANPHAKA